ncbi:MAG TPA: response regulator [Gammaproteobacteria bacterium]|nr:response regulator [Gammaproteobacteria bacterium]
MSGEAILIIEDNLLNLKMMDYLLTAKKYDVYRAMDAREALSLLETVKPALILVDIQLPGMDGLELTRKLKADPRYKHIPVIAITAYAMKTDKEKALAAGCNGYIAKPVDIKTLPDIIDKYIHS